MTYDTKPLIEKIFSGVAAGASDISEPVIMMQPSAVLTILDAIDAAQRERLEALARLKRYEPVHSFNGLTIDQWKERAERAEREKQTVIDMAMTESKRMESALITEREISRKLNAEIDQIQSEWRAQIAAATSPETIALVMVNTGLTFGQVRELIKAALKVTP